MRPALEALAEQQKQLSEMNMRYAKAFEQQNNYIEGLARGLTTLAQYAGIEPRVAASMLKLADVQNPAQPVPEPPAVPPVETTEQAKTPEAFADVSTPGLVPGSTQDVAADAVSTVYTPGTDIDGQALKNLVDVTAPVDGTQNPRPLSEVKTLTDVRVGDPMRRDTAFPLRGPWQNAQRTDMPQQRAASLQTQANRQAQGSERMVAALRLARLRIASQTAESEDDLSEATSIEKDASLDMNAINLEIRTLEGVSKAATRRGGSNNGNGRRPAGLVPRQTGGPQRTVPSMQGTRVTAQHQQASADSDVEDLFL